MTAADLIYPVLGPVVSFIVTMAVIGIGFALLHMIGKTN